MHAAPTATSHHDVAAASTSPATAPPAKVSTEAVSTARGEAKPWATRRTGPMRSASVPRMPSE